MQVVVIADDFSGAAEMAGISRNFGLTVEICFGEVVPSDSDVLVVCTDSRSKKIEKALAINASILNKLKQAQVPFIFKKTDSALRGYLLEETRLQMQVLGKRSALIIPANPSLGRVIKDKNYLVNGVAISRTPFADDPEFPVRESNVEIFFNGQAGVIKCKGAIPLEGITIGEAESASDVRCWAARADDSMVLAGAGDFFEALLERKYTRETSAFTEYRSPHLFVSGTRFEESRRRIGHAFELGAPVFYLDGSILASNDFGFLSSIGSTLRRDKRLVLAIDQRDIPCTMTAELIRERMGTIVEKIVHQYNIAEIFIEGGSTAGAILKKLGIGRLQVVGEWERGVVRMMEEGLYITIKPGSYPLPKEIKQLYGI
jgi:uncharacterized protein YgbK (DUF1537 family)